MNGWLQLPSNFTLEAVPGHKAVINGALMVKGQSNVIIRDLRVQADDSWGNPGDTDALFLNGLRGPVNRIAISNVTGIWGPDIGGLAVLGDVNDVTVQCSILGEGLRFSAHHEGGEPTGHSMGLSVFQLDTAVDPADRVTFWGNLVTTSDRRMPVIHGARNVDWINNASYNFGRNGPDGNPRSMNYIGNLVKAGPISQLPNDVWRSRPHTANPCCYARSVYIANNLAANMAYSEDIPASVRADVPFPLSVNPFPAGNVQAFLVANAGPLIRDSTDTRLLDNLVNGTGGYVDAADVP